MNLGPFHIMCYYLGSLGKMMCESGFEDIVTEAGLCASGSIEQVTEQLTLTLTQIQNQLDHTDADQAITIAKRQILRSNTRVNAESTENLIRVSASEMWLLLWQLDISCGFDDPCTT